MNKLLKWGLLILGFMMTLWAGSARAESQYGYQPSGSGGVSAQADVNVRVNVPQIILLRVGATNTTVDTVTFQISATITAQGGGSTTTAVVGNNQTVDWDANVPTFTAPTSDLVASAWTNATGATVACAMPAFSPVGGPAVGDLEAAATGGTLAHPSATLACGTTTALGALGAVKSSTWRYTLNMTNAGTWAPGSYTTTITYTASAP